jgi:hypothetical protein
MNDFWTIATDMRPKMEDWARTRYGRTYEDAEDLVSAAIVKASRYGVQKSIPGLLMRTLGSLNLDQAKRGSNYERIVNAHFRVPNFSLDSFCFVMHDLRTSGVSVLGIRTCELIMVGCDVPEVRAVLDLTPVMFKDIQRTVAPCLSLYE